MLVKAKCVTVAWDSPNATRYEPGAGPLPGGLYEIDRDGPLASLKLGSTYVFEFDRNANPDDKPHDYSCKKDGCGKKFKTLAALGTHTKVDHKDDAEPPEKPEDDEPDEEEDEQVRARTCFLCDPPKVLKSPYGLQLHNQKSHPFQSQPESVAETTVPA
jgi:hypothetical protein